MNLQKLWLRTSASCLGASVAALIVLAPFAHPLAGRPSAAHTRVTKAVHVSPKPAPLPTHRSSQQSQQSQHATAPKRPPSAAAAPVSAGPLFGGLGAWIDMFDYTSLNVNRTVARMRTAGVRTLYLQTGTSRTPVPVMPGARPWLVAAHRAGIKVVGWYVPYYSHTGFDIRRTIAIKNYRVNGVAFDGLGVDIEVRGHVKGHSNWNRRVVAELRSVRHAVGSKYPVAAIPPPPLQMRVAPNYWRAFPWKGIGQYSDAILLMSYWSGRIGCPEILWQCAYGYTKGNVEITRRLVQRPSVAIHVIGGIAEAINGAELAAFIRGAQDAHADGASIYDVSSMPARWWEPLSHLQTLGK